MIYNKTLRCSLATVVKLISLFPNTFGIVD